MENFTKSLDTIHRNNIPCDGGSAYDVTDMYSTQQVPSLWNPVK